MTINDYDCVFVLLIIVLVNIYQRWTDSALSLSLYKFRFTVGVPDSIALRGHPAVFAGVLRCCIHLSQQLRFQC
jgi:hypothetical protein